MFRLRTTTSLSLLAMVIGIGGTLWLSGQTAGWGGPVTRVAGFASVSHHAVSHHTASYDTVAKPARRTARPVLRATAMVWRAVTTPRAAALPALADAQAGEAPPPELVPLSMPSVSVPYAELQGHLRGRVLLHLQIDGSGHVVDAALAESSGDPVLDAHALASVRQWRFAVPADHPDGLSGDLPMRFTSGRDVVASAP